MKTDFKNKVFVGIALIAYIIISTLLIISTHLYWNPQNCHYLLRSHIMCGLFGMLGASISATRKYYRSLINEKNHEISGKEFIKLDWSYIWVYYYITRPIIGSILGALVYTLSYTGYFLLSNQTEAIISLKGKYLLFAISFLSGFSSSHVLDRLEQISKDVFRSDKI